MDRLLLQVRAVLGRDPVEGEAYVFGNRAGTRIKLLCCDRHGKRLNPLGCQRIRHPKSAGEVRNFGNQETQSLCVTNQSYQ